MSGRLRPQALITHRFTLAEIVKAYDTFANAGGEHALKVIVANDGPVAAATVNAP